MRSTATRRAQEEFALREEEKQSGHFIFSRYGIGTSTDRAPTARVIFEPSCEELRRSNDVKRHLRLVD